MNVKYPRRSPSRIVGTDLPPFSSSDTQWNEVIPVLPPDIRKRPEAARRWFEHIGRHYRSVFPADPAARAKEWHDIADLSGRLAQKINAVRNEEHYLQWFVLACADVKEEALDNADQYELPALDKRGRRRHLERRWH